jgi:D-amino-acid oxidase
MTQHADTLVIGAGIIGLTCAVALAEAGVRVEVKAEDIPGPTSLAAGALWGPYLVEPHAQVRRWALTTYEEFAQLAEDPATGVRMTPGIEASRTTAPPPDFTDMVPDLSVLGPAQLPEGFAGGVRYIAPLIDMPVYLEILLERLRAAGARIRKEHVSSLDGASAVAPFVINATGLGARALTGDETLYPIRGQLAVIENPGISEWFSEDTGAAHELTHWYPHGDRLVLGGQAVPGSGAHEPDLDVAAGILARCAAIEPSLTGAPILEHRVGLRPTRPRIRFETEQRGSCTLVHCYGHGGAGASLSWGVARDVQRILTGQATLRE